ncbi:hypothetical protein LG290_07790 [Halomonas sediminis]
MAVDTLVSHISKELFDEEGTDTAFPTYYAQTAVLRKASTGVLPRPFGT